MRRSTRDLLVDELPPLLFASTIAATIVLTFFAPRILVGIVLSIVAATFAAFVILVLSIIPARIFYGCWFWERSKVWYGAKERIANLGLRIDHHERVDQTDGRRIQELHATIDGLQRQLAQQGAGATMGWTYSGGNGGIKG